MKKKETRNLRILIQAGNKDTTKEFTYFWSMLSSYRNQFIKLRYKLTEWFPDNDNMNISQVNPFGPNTPFLYPMKTENR